MEEDGTARPCSPAEQEQLPAVLDPETCWSQEGATSPLLVGDTLFAVLDPTTDGTGAEAGPAVVAFDAATGAGQWQSDPLPGEVLSGPHLVEVDGGPGVAVIAQTTEEADAVSERGTSWVYAAWPGEVDRDTPTAPAVTSTAPVNSTADTSVLWTEAGVLAGDEFVAAGTDDFTPVAAGEPVVVEDAPGYPEELTESLVGVSGDTVVSAVYGVSLLDVGQATLRQWYGLVGRSFDGTERWRHLDSIDGEDVAIYGGPIPLATVVGSQVLAAVSDPRNLGEYGEVGNVVWYDAVSGEQVAPASGDLAGSIATGGAVVSTNGAHLFLHTAANLRWELQLESAWILDVEAGTATLIESDFDVAATTADDTVLYGTSDTGALTIDLATATASALPEPQAGVEAIDDQVGAAVGQGPDSTTPVLLVGSRAR